MPSESNESESRSRLIILGQEPETSNRIFAFNPVLAAFPGPWRYSRSPVLGVLLFVVGVAMLIADVAWFALDLFALVPDRDMNHRLAFAFVALVVAGAFIVAGRVLQRGRLRDSESGKRVKEDTFNLAGSTELGQELHDGLRVGKVTQRKLLSGGTGGWKHDCFVRVYRFPELSRVIATVHFVSDEGVHVWPPLGITPEYADELTVRGHSEANISYT
ncbi:hypothetical protein [uncultured Agrococcus sp.]|uniref:hypothetical protein n=1 Tax=uncultured Agrococcus sp. TaxID=382258 RepID=UPI0025FCD846|nr:hypothetical protein [uncultured Agrococcus sp.]